MDVYCPKCGEPWDTYEFHDPWEPMSYDEARKLFRSQGCGVVFNGTPCQGEPGMRGKASGMLMDLLGDDTDGVAALLDDFEYVGLLEDS